MPLSGDIFLRALRFVSIKATKATKAFESIPGPKPLPLIGNIWRYLPVIGQYKPNSLYENALYNRNRYGPIVREKITNSLTVLHLFQPQDIESLFRQDGKHPHRRSHRALLKYRHEHPDLYRDGGLFPENGQNWYRLRMQFQARMLSKSQVLANADKLDHVAQETFSKIDRMFDDDPHSVHIRDFENVLYQWALGNSLALFLDQDIYQLDKQTIERLISELHNSLTAIDKTEITTNKWIKSPHKCPFYKMLADSQDYLYMFVSDIVARAKQLPRPAISYLHDWIHLDKLDEKDIISFIIDLLMAGMHTTSYTTAFLMRNIANHDQVLQSLRSEIDHHIPREAFVTGAQIDQLTLLRNCLRETLRLNPVSIGTGRLADQDDIVIRSFDIPKGTQIITQNQVISRDPEVYEQPNKFHPDRWVKYRHLPRDERPSPFATLPFGFGTRSCLGQPLSELQIKLFVARFIQRYNFEMTGQIPIKTTLIHNLAGNVGIKVTKK